MSAQSLGHSAQNATHRAAKNRNVLLLGRIGIVAYGVVHLALAYLAAQIALGARTPQANKSGALQTLAAEAGGRVLLWAIAVGLVAAAVWQVGEAVAGKRWVRPERKRTRKRIECAAMAVVFGALAFSAGKLATGQGASSGNAQTFTAKVLALPAGQFLVAVVGIAIVVIAGFLVYKGFKKKFAEDLELSSASPTARKTALRLGQVGYVALGIAYGIMGLLVIVAAVTYNASKAAGLDPALKTLAAQPYGTALLLAVAAGLACFGVFCLFDARYRKA
jgi:hypothetical protein